MKHILLAILFIIALIFALVIDTIIAIFVLLWTFNPTSGYGNIEYYSLSKAVASNVISDGEDTHSDYI